MYNNYYNPFNYQPRMVNKNIMNKNLFSNLFHKFNFNNLLNNTSKTLNVINQAIPLYYQIKPLFNNAKTALKIFNAINTEDIKVNNNIKNNNTNNYTKSYNNYDNPIFFI